MKNLNPRFFLVPLFLVLLVSPRFAAAQEKIVNVEIEVVRSRSLSHAESYVGELKAIKEYEVRALREGVIEFLTKSGEGDRVREGKILAKIDAANAATTLRGAYIRLEQSLLNVVAAEKNYASAVLGVQISRQQLNSVEKDFKRDKALFEKKILSEKLFLASQNAYLTKKLQFDLERQKLIRSNGDFGRIPSFNTVELYRSHRRKLDQLKLPAAPDINYLPLITARVAFESAKIDYAKSRKSFDDSILKAPADGLLQAKNREPLEFTQKGGVLFKIARINPILVKFGVRETELGDFPKGQTIDVLLEAFPNRTLKAKVKKIGLTADPQSRRYDVELSLANPRNEFRPGMTARVNLKTKADRSYISVPLIALIQSHKENYVFVVENNRARKAVVEIAEIVLNEVRILSGLEKGQELIVQGGRFLRDGDRVRILNPR